MAKINLGRVVGDGLEFKWDDTKLGVKKEAEEEYQYIDLKGPKGEKGDPGKDAEFTKEEIIDKLGYVPEDKTHAAKEIKRLESQFKEELYKQIGYIDELTTEDKTNIVNAINEIVKTKVTQDDIDKTINDYNLAIGQVIAEVQNKVLAMDVDKAERSDLKKLDKELNDKIGNLNDLTTEEKENIVKAINELMENKATHQDILDEIDEYNIAVGIVTGDLTSKILELNSKKADKDDVVTSVNGQKGDVVIEGGNGGGGVTSVNGETGDVELDASKIPYSKWGSVKDELDFKANSWDLLDYPKKDDVVTSVNGQKGDVILELTGGGSQEIHTDNEVSENMYPRDFKEGITIGNVRLKSQFPSVDEWGVVITFINEDSGYGQIFITAGGDTWTRRSNSLSSWRSWYSVKKELNNKADKSDLQDLDLAGRTSTIVIANYDSHENSKKGADIVINKGENASEKINDVIQSLKGIGGEVKLMEGNYNLEYGIAVNVDGVHLTGIPGSTILVQNQNWKGNPYNSNRKAIVDTKSDIDNLEVTISNLYVKGANISGSNGFSCSGSSTINNCISENSGNNGFSCSGSSTINNCISENSRYYGFFCLSSFKGICSFNILKGDKINDISSSPAIVEYNIIQEG